ncbi:MAG: hypothetical protein K2Y18_03610 [Alphaproteobacteria bacterium]|nr:hypothetical protein [Alphaproteobacteria bacterium]
MLRLIAKESPISIYRHNVSKYAEKTKSSSIHSLQQPFLFDFQEISSGIYVARFLDTFHELSCDFALEVRDVLIPSGDEYEEPYLQPVLVGEFPLLDTRRFQQKVLWDEYLQGMALIQFQLKILEQLLLFCEDKFATHLLLTFNDVNQDYLEIYQRFIISEEQILCAHNEKTEIAIPTDVTVYDDLIDFIEEVDHKFRQTLWSEHRTNSIYRHYLKSEAIV